MHESVADGILPSLSTVNDALDTALYRDVPHEGSRCNNFIGMEGMRLQLINL